MEYTQWACVVRSSFLSLSLNPCCNGIYSMSTQWFGHDLCTKVLILVVMEYTQWGLEKEANGKSAQS